MENGKCQCGCGATTPIATKTDARRGYKKGEPTKYLPGHVARTQGRTAVLIRPNEAGEITQDDIIALREVSDEVAAQTLDARSRAIERFATRSFAELGMIGHEMRERGLWARLAHPDTGVAYHSWEDWATSVFRVSRNTAFTAARLFKATRDVPVEDLKEMTRQNLAHLAKLSPAVQKKPETIRRAKEETEEEFVNHIQKNHPDQHVEKSPTLVQNFSDPNNRKHLDHAVEIAMWSYEVESREDAIANIVAYFLDGRCDKQGFVKMSNRDAFKQAHGRKTA